MKTISLPVYNRPEALKRMLESWRKNNTDGWMLFVSSDCHHGESEKGVKESRALIVEMASVLPTYLSEYMTPLGLTLNTFLAPSLAFAAGSDFNLYLEDDLILSPDALDLCNWYYDWHGASDVVGLKLWRDCKVDNHISVSKQSQGGHGNGFCCSRGEWENFWRKEWFGYGTEGPGKQFDIHTDNRLRELGLHILSPLYPRSVQQRTDGTHGKANDDNPLMSVEIYQGPPVKEFKLS